MADDASWIVPPRRALPEIVADRVVEAIRTGDLKPGERIVEATLAKRLGVSRGPLREALKVLEDYQSAYDHSDVAKELKLVRNVKPLMSRFGTVRALVTR